MSEEYFRAGEQFVSAMRAMQCAARNVVSCAEVDRDERIQDLRTALQALDAASMAAKKASLTQYPAAASGRRGVSVSVPRIDGETEEEHRRRHMKASFGAARRMGLQIDPSEEARCLGAKT